jgi:Ca2+-binding RTX toxin-like protein
MANHITDLPGLDSNLEGTAAKDVILGLDGEDVLYGEAGNDVLHAGPAPEFGYDQLFGGRGHDKFIFDSGDGSAQIEDFKISQGDRLDLSGTTFDKHDLKDTFDNDRDGDGNYVRETQANGKPETALHFNNPDITDSLNLIGVTARDLRHDVRDHPTHYDFG